jgi:hypothetical protein
LAEKGLQLLDTVDDRQHDAAGAFAGKPGRSERRNLVVEAAAQLLLHSGGGAVGDHRAMVIDDPAQNHGNGHPERRDRHCPEAGTLEYMRQQHAEDRKPRDPDDRSDQPEQDREDNPAAQPARQLPKSWVEIHQRFPVNRRNSARRS